LKSFNVLIDIIEDYNAKGTFPITAITLEKNLDAIKDLRSKSIEWAMHGLIHKDYTLYNENIINDHIKKGKKIFKDAKINIVGFRAPYLSSNKKIATILSKNEFIYDSSKCYFVNVLPTNLKKIEIILDYYKPLKKWRIDDYNGMKEIPVCFPDDEILVDRLKYKGDKIGRIWIELCKKMFGLGGTPVLAIHPERGKI
jgi:peptidoglycan/xylan/chitin deacetylase (PgdA/CDA1 family)